MVFALATLVALPSPAVAQEAAPAASPSAMPARVQLSEDISANGSSTVGPMTQAVAEEFAAMPPHLAAEVDYVASPASGKPCWPGLLLRRPGSSVQGDAGWESGL